MKRHQEEYAGMLFCHIMFVTTLISTTTIIRKCFKAYDNYEKSRNEIDAAFEKALSILPLSSSYGQKRAADGNISTDSDAPPRKIQARIRGGSVTSGEAGLSPPVMVSNC